MTGHRDTKLLTEKALLRVNIKDILADPVKRRYMLIKGIMSVQAIEGRYITYERAAEALDAIQEDADDVASD